MFECSFKFSEKDNEIGTIATMRQQPQKAVKILKWVLPILMLLNIALLVWDIQDGESITLDIILIITVAISMAMIYSMPYLYKYMAKRTYQKNLADKDKFSVYIDEDKCSVAFFKNNKEVLKEVLSLAELTTYEEDEVRLILIFNMKFVVIRKEYLRGE